MSTAWPTALMGEIAPLVRRPVQPDANELYREIGIRSFGKGVFHKAPTTGFEIGDKRVFAVKPGDLLFNIVFAWEGAIAVASESEQGMIGSHRFLTCVADNTKVDAKFLRYWFTHTEGRDRLLRASPGGAGRNRTLGVDKLAAIHVPLPPLEEQRRIVARIEAIAEKVREAVALRVACVEERGALFSRELADRRRSLSQTYPSVALGSLTRVTSGGTPSRNNPSYWGGDIPWIKTGELLDGVIDSAEEYITDAGLANSSAKLFPPDTVLIALYGQGQTRGRTGRLAISAATNQACCAVLPCEQLHPQYLQWWFRSLYQELREDAKGGAQPNWSGGMIKDLLIAVPPLARQIEIASECDAFQCKLRSVTTLQSETANELHGMLPAILDKAFKGEL